MSAQTTERLLQILPPFLGSSVKYELLRKLREKYRLPESHSIEVTTANYRNLVNPLVQRLIAKAYSANLPVALEERLGWLSHADTEAAKSLMAGAEASAMAAMLSRLDEEFAQMERLLSLAPRGTLRHRIELPYGIITLSVKKGQPMEDGKKSTEIATSRTIDSSAITTSDQLIKHAIRNLTPEQMSEISKKATDVAITLQEEAVRADQRFTNAAKDIDHLVDTVKESERLGGDYKHSGNYNTASGTTSVNFRRDSSKIWIIAAIALAVLVLLLVMRH